MNNQILQGDIIDVIQTLLAESVNCIITSPPYFGLRNYGLPSTDWPEVTYAPMPDLSPLMIPAMTCCLGLEDSIEAYVGHMVFVFRGLWRVLRGDGTAWLNLGDSYASSSKGSIVTENSTLSGSKTYQANGTPPNLFDKTKLGLNKKNLIGIPWRIAFALQADGWYLRSDVIWAKKNPMPESVTDRPTKGHEYLFLLTKSERYWCDMDAIREENTWPDHNRFGNKNENARMVKILTGNMRSDAPEYTDRVGRNKRTVWSYIDEIAEHNELLAFTLARLASGNPELLDNILDEFGSTPDEKSDVWELATKPYKAAHFAVMPEALVEPCLLAGCPSQICAECGEPWVRVTEKSTEEHPNRWGKGPQKYMASSEAEQGQTNLEKSNLGTRVNVKTIGFTPTCQCSAPHRSGITLDPFFGSGTVGVVAKRNKRDWLGIELNSDYIKMARERLDQTQPALFM